jgi:hypothetical protein
MALLKRMIGLLLLALGLLGCGTPADGNNGRNLTIMLQCAETRPVPLNVVGEVSVDTRTLGTSNCSVYSHGAVSQDRTTCISHGPKGAGQSASRRKRVDTLAVGR